MFFRRLFRNLMFLTTVSVGLGSIPLAAQTAGPDDLKIQQELQKSLKGSRFKDIQIAVQNGMVKLTGTVPVLQDKEDADKKAHHDDKKGSVENDIEVASTDISDAQLQAKLLKALSYDRVGYGNAFNAIDLTVRNGVVTLAGHALGPVAKDSAVSLAANTPGVRDIVDDIEVDPVSPMDNDTRVRVARAVYGYPSLNKYAIDPAAPIRITVVSGHVILSGVVISKSDKDVAGLQANTVPGVFSVTNNLQVATGNSEK